MSNPKPRTEAPKLQAVKESGESVDVSSLTQMLTRAHQLVNLLHIQASQDNVTGEIKQSIAHVNNELVKVQNELATDSEK